MLVSAPYRPTGTQEQSQELLPSRQNSVSRHVSTDGQGWKQATVAADG